MSVAIRVTCQKCGELEQVKLGAWEAASNFMIGKCHNAIPDSHAKMRNLLDTRLCGYNTYNDTRCEELAAVDYGKAKKGCKGLINVEFTGLTQ
ncbi:unnamed protein product [Amoebophrya sp. A120]|nr:unnamed protein product [Amoebophrya sp. A120]|eukprot:GSA120T00025177001.1